ncbi:Dynactin subunit 1 [Homalodisca vitripennis]|nr:Dynactin subunit 1 [Homalodisca vitripennis]
MINLVLKLYYFNSLKCETKFFAHKPDECSVTLAQTGFVETLKPQFTPGQVLASPSTSQSQPPSARPPPPPPVDPEELANFKSQVQDLGEKLETIKIKYKEKSHEVEQLKIQLDQAQEFKAKMLDAQAALKKELERARREAERANEAKEEMSDIAETLELITLDKEMAEEKVESLQLELEQAREKLEEVMLDYQLLKEEMSEKRGETDQNVPTSYEMRQLEQQNARLRDTLVRMRDLAAHEKHEMLKLTRDLEAKKAENADLTKTNEKLIARTTELENQVTDLHEQDFFSTRFFGQRDVELNFLKTVLGWGKGFVILAVGCICASCHLVPSNRLPATTRLITCAGLPWKVATFI